LVEIFKTLADQNRLRILNLLLHYELCVCELEVVLNLTQSNTSRHLGKLRQINLLSDNKDAQWVHYRYNESFDSENVLLIQYIKEQYLKESLYAEDLQRCRKYVESSYDCQDIKADQQKVSDYLFNR
jgi:ArsR family transcriptional regulator